jgi:YfiH family protein
VYAFRATVGPVDLAFTDRFGGVSGVPYDELNLGINTADDDAAVAANLARVLADFAPDLDPASAVLDMQQVHGDAVLCVDADDATGARVACDGLITDTPDLVLMVRAADCVPVLLADLDRGLVGAVHAGRPGLAAGIVPEAVAGLRTQGADRLIAWIGPHVCGACYEVPAGMQAEVSEAVPAAASTTSWGTPALDIGAGVRAQLEEAGVTVHDASRCTRESADLFSFRRDGQHSGRQAGLIRLRGPRHE